MEDIKDKGYRSRHDSLINKVFWNGNRVIRVNFISKHPNISEYLLSRYKDSDSYRETIQRIKLGIEEKPKCPTCGKPVNFIGKQKKMFSKYCCNSCRARNKETHIKANQTYFKRTGYTHNSRNPESQERIKQTCQKRYGANSVVESYKGKEGRIKSFGKLSFFQTDKFKHDLREVYDENKSPDNCIRLNKDEIIDKIFNKMKINKSFSKSKEEDDLFEYIKSKYPLVKRQYKDKIRYPYHCDFYIPELDYFIELQGYYTHNTHPYNPNSILDQVLVERYKEKYGPKCQSITIWTIKDVEKRNCAKKHNLNFKEVWTLEEGKEFIDDLYEKREIP